MAIVQGLHCIKCCEFLCSILYVIWTDMSENKLFVIVIVKKKSAVRQGWVASQSNNYLKSIFKHTYLYVDTDVAVHAPLLWHATVCD